MRQGTKNGNAPEFSGRLEPTTQGCRLEGVIRFANLARLILTVMFAVPGWFLVAAFATGRSPAGGILFPLFMLVALCGVVVFFALGFAEREPFLRAWLQDAMALGAQQAEPPT